MRPNPTMVIWACILLVSSLAGVSGDVSDTVLKLRQGLEERHEGQQEGRTKTAPGGIVLDSRGQVSAANAQARIYPTHADARAYGRKPEILNSCLERVRQPRSDSLNKYIYKDQAKASEYAGELSFLVLCEGSSQEIACEEGEKIQVRSVEHPYAECDRVRRVSEACCFADCPGRDTACVQLAFKLVACQHCLP